jgi:hypothetical protein
VLILPMLFGAFQPPKPENRILLRYLMVKGTSFHALQSSSVPGLRKVFELGMYRANEVLVLDPGKDRCGSARNGLRRLKSSERHG